MQLRQAAPADLAGITSIYAHHVRHGTGSFEETPPTLDEMRARHRAIVDAGYPWFVADGGGGLAGYAYAGPYKTRSAYRFTVEDSVYVDPAHTGRGVGSALLERLIEICAGAGYRQMMAVVGDSENGASLALHRRHGFREIGRAEAIGYKFGRWLDIVYLQRALGEPR